MDGGNRVSPQCGLTGLTSTKSIPYGSAEGVLHARLPRMQDHCCTPDLVPAATYGAAFSMHPAADKAPPMRPMLHPSLPPAATAVYGYLHLQTIALPHSAHAPSTRPTPKERHRDREALRRSQACSAHV